MNDIPLQRTEARLLAQLAEQRRATQHFRPDPVPESVIQTALAIAAQAPSGYNFQPWRFLVLTEADRRAALRKAAFDQPKITEAPLAIVSFGQRGGWKEYVEPVMQTSAARRGIAPSAVEQMKQGALQFVDSHDPAVWLNRHVMIAFTYLMLAFEAQGWDTAPMEGFDGAAVKKTFELPEDAEVVALLAVGRAQSENAHPGRLTVDHIAFKNRYGEPYPATVHFGPKTNEEATAGSRR
jgi:nitroreductase